LKRVDLPTLGKPTIPALNIRTAKLTRNRFLPR
jgi:hypothetical protein